MSELIRILKEKIEHLVDMDSGDDNCVMTQIRAEKIDLYEKVIKELSASQASEAEMRNVLDAAYEIDRMNKELAKKLEAAEARIKASQDQEPIGEVKADFMGCISVEVSSFGFGELERGDRVFKYPTILPELAELQRENVELRTMLAAAPQLPQEQEPESREAILLEVETAIADGLGPDGYKAYHIIQKLKKAQPPKEQT